MKKIDPDKIDEWIWKQRDLTNTCDDLRDIINTETLSYEYGLVEEGSNYFDGYTFGYTGRRALKCVEQQFKPLSVYDNYEYVVRRERENARRKQRERKIEATMRAYQKRKEKEEKARVRAKLKKMEEDSKKHIESFERFQEDQKKGIILEERKQTESKRVLVFDPPHYDPYFPIQLSPPIKKTDPFKILRKTYETVYGKSGYEEKFLVEQLGCSGLSWVEMERLLSSVWPDRNWNDECGKDEGNEKNNSEPTFLDEIKEILNAETNMFFKKIMSEIERILSTRE